MIEVNVGFITSIQAAFIPPANFKLYQNYPNPFNPATKIKYAIKNVDGLTGLLSASLKIYDILGAEVSTLVNEKIPAGEYEVEFIAEDILPSGIYYYRLTAGEYSETKMMIFLK